MSSATSATVLRSMLQKRSATHTPYIGGVAAPCCAGQWRMKKEGEMNEGMDAQEYGMSGLDTHHQQEAAAALWRQRN